MRRLPDATNGFGGLRHSKEQSNIHHLTEGADQMRSEKDRKQEQKLDYTAPRLVVHGSVETITQNAGAGTADLSLGSRFEP